MASSSRSRSINGVGSDKTVDGIAPKVGNAASGLAPPTRRRGLGSVISPVPAARGRL